MTKLFLHSREMKSVFQLLGEHQNDISYSVAWGLTQCPSFLKVFLQSVLQWNGNVDEVEIRMQEYEKGKGFTDIEIELTQQFHLIIEASEVRTSQASLSFKNMRPEHPSYKVPVLISV